MASPFCKVGRETAHEGSAINRVAEPKLVWGLTPIGAEGEGGHFPFALGGHRFIVRYYRRREAVGVKWCLAGLDPSGNGGGKLGLIANTLKQGRGAF